MVNEIFAYGLSATDDCKDVNNDFLCFCLISVNNIFVNNIAWVDLRTLHIAISIDSQYFSLTFIKPSSLIA